MAIPTILTRTDRRTLAVSVTKDAKVVVKAPLFMPLSEINSFLTEKQKWILEKLSFVKNNLTKNADILGYENFLFLGQKYKPFQAEVDTLVFDEQSRLLLPKHFSKNEALGAITKHYKKLSKRILLERINVVASSISVFPKSVKLSNSKGRWGSCSNSKTVSFNWRLVLLEPKLIDYVIVHELSHLFELNHSDQFWNRVSKVVPDYVILRKLLNEYSFLLNMFR